MAARVLRRLEAFPHVAHFLEETLTWLQLWDANAALAQDELCQQDDVSDPATHFLSPHL